MISDFHFLRPWWLLAMIPCAFIVWASFRRADATQAWRGIVAPHLLPFLLQGQAQSRKLSPLLLLVAGWLLGVLAVAGPAWRREPAPFADDTAALAIVVKLSPSMTTEDVQPSRLARSVQKIQDLLKLRQGAKTSLIAYAGTAHVVMPATTDDGIILTFAQALDPKVMPKEGDSAAAALALADRTLAESGSGSILWITDGVAPEQSAALRDWRRRSSSPIHLFPPLLPGSEQEALVAATRGLDTHLVPLAADDSDVTAVSRSAKFVNATTPGSGTRWAEDGRWLAWPLALLLLPFFRRGWILPAGGTS